MANGLWVKTQCILQTTKPLCSQCLTKALNSLHIPLPHSLGSLPLVKTRVCNQTIALQQQMTVITEWPALKAKIKHISNSQRPVI